MKTPGISVIVPVYNENENLAELDVRLNTALLEMGVEYEIIYVDDGSDDGSKEVLADQAKNNSAIKIVTFARNFGQTAAMQAGINLSQGSIIVTIDGDLQNSPEDIPGMVESLKKNKAAVISGWRKNRKDGVFRVFVSACANKLVSLICGLRLHDYGCTLKAYRASYIKDIRLYGEMHRFIPAFIYWRGGAVLEKEVLHSPRIRGCSSYGMDRIPRVILDLFTAKFLISYYSRPLHFFGSFGITSIILSAFTFVFVIIRKLAYNGEWLSPLFFISVFLGGLGVMIILMGIIAEIAVRVYYSLPGNLPYKFEE